MPQTALQIGYRNGQATFYQLLKLLSPLIDEKVALIFSECLSAEFFVFTRSSEKLMQEFHTQQF
jgi:hypothetical protein